MTEPIDYSAIPINEVITLIGERIEEVKSRNLNWGPIGPLHPRTMLIFLDMMLRVEDPSHA